MNHLNLKGSEVLSSRKMGKYEENFTKNIKKKFKKRSYPRREKI